jgi:hypothetical protein
MSNNGVPIQDIADIVGRKSTHVTETVYRHVIAPARGPRAAPSLALQAAATAPGRCRAWWRGCRHRRTAFGIGLAGGRGGLQRST